MSTPINDTLTLAVAGLSDTRSKFKAAAYTRPTLTDSDLLAAYEGSSLISRVVDVPAEDATRKWREWQADPEQITAIEKVEVSLGIKSKLKDAFSDARLFGDGYIFMDNGEDVTEPLDPDTAAPLRFVVKVDRWQISEGDYDFDPLSPTYNRPAYYELMGSDTSLLRIHPSRVVHLVGKKRKQVGASIRLGQSVITSMFDDMKGFDAVMANVADMTFEAKIDVMKIAGLMQKVTDPSELAALQSKLQLAMYTKAVNGALILDMDDEEWQQKQLSFATLPDIIDRFQIAASGAARIPRAMLFGTSAGGLGATGDLEVRNYYDMIASIQENGIQPEMHVLDSMTVKTALGVIPPEIHYNWRSLWQMDDQQRADIGEKIVKKYVDAVNAGFMPQSIAFEQTVNELTEAGAAPGLEKAAEDWRNGGGDLDEGAEEDTLLT